MKAIVLAAGEGKRMRPLTLKTPKPLLKINNRPILDYILESFPIEIDEVIIVVKYLGDQIKRHVGGKNRHMKITYVQGSERGNAYSFMAAREVLKGQRFLLVQGDELVDRADIVNCLKKDLSVLVFDSNNPRDHGIGFLHADGSLAKIVEKPKNSESNIGVFGVMVLNSDIFDYGPQMSGGEYYFSTLVGQFVRDHKVYPVKNKYSIGDITAPHDLTRASDILKTRLQS